jgi:hypothetical protein
MLSKRHHSAPRSKALSNVKLACQFLNVVTEERPASSIAAEIWRKLKTPDMLLVWTVNLKMHRFAIEAAKYYDNRACR